MSLRHPRSRSCCQMKLLLNLLLRTNIHLPVFHVLVSALRFGMAQAGEVREGLSRQAGLGLVCEVMLVISLR